MDVANTKPPLPLTLIVYCLGIAAMLPWNFFITCDSFWQYKLRNVTLGDDWDTSNATMTVLQVSFMPTLVVISNLFCTIFLFFTSWIVTRVSEQIRVVAALVVMIVVMITITIMAVVPTDSWQTVFYGIVMLLVAILNMFEAVYQGSLYGIAGVLPSACTNALTSGMAVAGVLSSIAQIVSLAIGDADPITSGLVFFLIADVFLVLSLILYYSMRRMDFYKLCKQENQNKRVAQSPKTRNAYWIVFKKIWWQSFTLGLGLMITLSIYPAMQLYVTSTTPDGAWKNIYFQPTITFLLFNIGDVLGREMPRWIRWPGSRGWKLPVLCGSRVLLLVAIMFCHGDDKTFPILFYNDAWYIIFNALFGLTNGYFGCLPLIYYPEFVEAEEVELAGTIMGAVMGAGMVIGSFLSPAFVAIWGPNF
uniref:Equilibrative nucleoside transporter 3-like n=2 Tax=Hirondellea gigas TaxID=1518452 RepID=A0A2P2IDH8_9CRUS